MPINHQQAKAANEWSKEELLGKAARIGENSVLVAERILGNSIYIEQNYKACFGMLMLEKDMGPVGWKPPVYWPLRACVSTTP